MIRKAEIADLPKIQGCANEFYSASRILARLPFSIDRFVTSWTNLIESGVGVVFISEDGGVVTGAIAGVTYPDLYSGVLVATEFFWVVLEEHRGSGVRLYMAFEDWARSQNCAQIRMVHLSDSMPDKVARFYEHFGYEPVETHYSKSLHYVKGTGA